MGNAIANAVTCNQTLYRRRETARIIRYRNYEIEDTTNYKREMVTLFFPFRNELVDILDRLKFLEILYIQSRRATDNEQTMGILSCSRKMNIQAAIDELRKLGEEGDDQTVDQVSDEREQ